MRVFVGLVGSLIAARVLRSICIALPRREEKDVDIGVEGERSGVRGGVEGAMDNLREGLPVMLSSRRIQRR